MTSNLPSSFASAAAGRDSRGARGDGRGAEWPRGRSSNGTLTLRRPSSALTQNASFQSTTSENTMQNQNPSAESTPVPQGANVAEPVPLRYTKDQILDVYAKHYGGASGVPQGNVSQLFVDGWQPGTGQVNGNSARGWGKPQESHQPQDADLCWNPTSEKKLLSFQEMSSEEREIFSTDVNSPLKPPQQNKDGNQAAGPNGRKASMSHGSGNPYSATTPSSARPGTRRRESLDPGPFSAAVASPTTAGGRFGRDESSPWFSRRGTELRDADGSGEVDSPTRDTSHAPAKPPFSSLLRSNTTGSGSAGGMSSLWGTSSSQTVSSPIGGGPSMGSFGNFALPSPTAAKPFGGARGESRLAHLIPKESSENIAAKASDAANPDLTRSWRARPRTDTDPFGDDNHGGSATAAAQGQQGGQDTFESAGKGLVGDLGFSSLRLAPSEQDPAPQSPSDTNPYRGADADQSGNHDEGEGEPEKGRSAAGEASHPLGSVRGYQANAFDGSDRSQTSSAGPSRYPTLSSLGGWPAPSTATVGTPDRERSAFGAFGNALFSPVGDIPSGGLGSIGSGVFGTPTGGPIGSSSSISRGSKLGSLFPAAMQAQMQNQDIDSHGDPMHDLRQNNPLGAIGRGNFPGAGREGDSARAGPNALEDLFGPASEGARPRGMYTSADAQPGLTTTAQTPSAFTTAPGSQFSGGQPAGDAPPASQVRQMVMPDRMRWVYLDPQGQVQGPFTGLEMNDWYKANFFTPDLRVRKIEDPDFEPLGQLIRRIGNSREPFLVPQIGVPHGPAPQPSPFATTGTGAVVPPLSGVFPSYGRTLTAEEQNNLERRKQEEQFLMAQQREFMLRQQAIPKYPIPGGAAAAGIAGSLHHHSSAHSLQSQPSFGSISSPIGVPPQGAIGQPASGPAGLFEGTIPQGMSAGVDVFREDDLANLSTPERQVIASLHGIGTIPGQFQPARTTQEGGSGLRTQLPTTEQLLEDPAGFRERLMEFEQLRQGREEEDARIGEAVKQEAAHGEEAFQQAMATPTATSQDANRPEGSGRTKSDETKANSLKEIQKAQAAAAKAQAQADAQAQAEAQAQAQHEAQAHAQAQAEAHASGLPMPFPAPEPFGEEVMDPAPMQPAQPPPMAPWAKELAPENHHKGPSLKEIQEAEARKAAKAEQVAQAARRAQLEQEAAELREKERAASSAVLPGLPTTSTWGQSPVNAGSASPWAKPASTTGKAVAAAQAPSAAGSEKRKKTLAEIQREEEARKMKAKEAAMTAGIAAGKRYADLASKPGPSSATHHAGPTPPPGSGWATVGAGGKVKAPPGAATPSAQAAPQARTVGGAGAHSVSVAKPAVVAAAPRPAPVANVAQKTDSVAVAMEEFKKWLHKELSRGLTSVSNIDDFAAALMCLPLDAEMISDAVYGYSTTMNGQHFAMEFIRLRKLAEKGVFDKQASVGGSGKGAATGGWNEVAKKGGSGAGQHGQQQHQAQKGPEEGGAMAGAGFKVVPGRKKGKK